MATWPGTLPDRPLIAGYREQPPDLLLRTAMDVGPAKVRRRALSGPRPVHEQYVLTKTQVATFETFFITTCLSGAVSFDKVNGRTGTTAVFRFVRVHPYEPIDPENWLVRLDLEILP